MALLSFPPEILFILWRTKGGSKMTYKQIETSREIRLWIGQVIVPAVAFSMAFPEVRNAAINKAKSIKERLARKSEKE
jgi:hypothetical protein